MKSALNSQIGGDHYKKLKYPPVEFITKNNLGFLEGCIIKRLCRIKGDRLEDLNKCIHEIELIKELTGLESDKISIENKEDKEDSIFDKDPIHPSEIIRSNKKRLKIFISEFKSLINFKIEWNRDDIKILIDGLYKTRY